MEHKASPSSETLMSHAISVTFGALAGYKEDEVASKSHYYNVQQQCMLCQHQDFDLDVIDALKACRT